MNPQREPRTTDDLDLLLLKERKSKLLSSPRASSKGLNVKQVIPDSFQEWPGLPRGVKFDPSDEELLWHLLAEVGKGVAKRHPFISEFIISLDEDHGFGNIHPQFLPGVKQDGSMSYFFHRTVEVFRSQMKRRKKHNYYVEFSWHKIGKTKPVFVDGIHQGSKEIMALYMIPLSGGNPEKTHWLMHQYHIATNGAEEDLVVSKIFCEMMSKKDTYELCTNSVECSVAEDACLGSPLPVAPDFQEERLHLEAISAEASTQSGFLRNLGAHGNSTNVFSCYRVRDDNMCHADDAHISLENSCAEKAPEHGSHKNVVDQMFKPQDRLMAASSSEFNTLGIHSSSAHKSIGSLETTPKCSGKDYVSLGGNPTTEHKIGHENPIIHSVVLAFPALNNKGNPLEESKPNTLSEKSSTNQLNSSTPSVFLIKLEPQSLEDTEINVASEKNSSGSEPNSDKNSTNRLSASAPSALPIKIEPQSLENTEIAVASEKCSTNSLNASTLAAFVIKVKAEPFEEVEAKFVQEKIDGKLPEVSHLIHLVMSSSPVNFCLPISSIHEKLIPYFYISKEGRPTFCNLSDQIYIPEEMHMPSAEILSTMISSLDKLILETTDLMDHHPKKDVDLYDCPLLNNGNSQGVSDNECFDQLSYPQLNFHAGEAQHYSFSSSSLKVKLESMECNLRTCQRISPCSTKELDIMLSKHPANFPLDILDHVPLKYRMGIPFSQGDVNMNTGNISEETTPGASGCGSFGSINAKASPFPLRRRKKTSTNSVEKALEEDAPGLLQILLDRGILVEQIKLYGDMEDNDPLEISSEDSFEELETVMAKLFSERSTLLRFSFGRAVKESRTAYCLACLISLIEQTRYLHFRRTPVEWGWCRDLQSFIFVFQTHNRIVVERPEYGYATYFFELVESLPVDWQIKRLVTAMKLTNCSRTILLENKPLAVGVDLTEGDARVMEAYGWTPNTGFGTMLNYCGRVVHDRRNEMYSSEWRSKIGKLLMSGYDGGRMVLTNIPMKAVEYMGSHCPEIKPEQSKHLSCNNRIALV